MVKYTPEGDIFYKVRMSPEFVESLSWRDIEGNRLSIDIGEPDAEGFYTPVITTHYDDNPWRDCAVHT